ncbi:MAG: DUF5723 family protein, partial [Dysgonamonadaceae bacterium]|nr:DUF5723 family protein [Dysgonamonadaceae bacterium]
MKQSHIELFKCARTLFVLFGICGFIHSATGQSANTEYFMSSSYTKTALNPALRPSKGYIGVPGLTNISLGYRTNTFVLNHFLFQGAGENQKTGLFLNENVSYDQFMKGISDRNYFNLDLDLTVLGFGFYAGDAFLSFDASLRADMEMNVPKDFFSFLKRGLSLGGADNKEYNFGNISLDGIVYGQIGLGGSYPFLDNSLLIGTKVKMLSGLMNGRVSLDQMRLNIGRDVWSVSDMQTSMQFVAKGIKPKYDGSGKFDGLDSDDFSFTSNGFGFGLDLGATFKPGYFLEDKSSFLNNFTVSMAVTDLGFINWNKSSSVYLATDPSGPIVITGDKEINFENSKNLFGDLSDAFGDAFDLKEKPDAIEGKTGLKARL